MWQMQEMIAAETPDAGGIFPKMIGDH